MDDLTWIPDACTLPTADRPFRMAEFGQLFADHLRGADRVDAQTLDLTLTPASREAVADLTARETACCSFFTFTMSESTDELHLTITVPPARTDVLDGLSERL
ncbi:hypothetical protein OHA18_33660 [Kribbella sp. NBC_00709]|uniref:hypothetical protein n=1 Tax=Kribbella sp. NBC_00709 TaxID=2975972 RepID=UPI002E29BE3B|nr:hypothetical protein [Kribbella sp. NBC_00709]